jgi:hypothetical protein
LYAFGQAKIKSEALVFAQFVRSASFFHPLKQYRKDDGFS